MDPGFDMPTRVIFDYEIIYLESGELGVEVEDAHYRAIPGDIIVFRPRRPHALHDVCNRPIHQPHIHFDLIQDANSPYVYTSFANLSDINPREYALFRKDILDEFYPDLPPVLRLRNSKEIEGLLMAIIYEKENRMIHSDMMANGLFLQLFSTLLRGASLNQDEEIKADSSRKIAERVRDYLNRNLDRDVSLNELSNSIHISKYYICRQFKQVFGVSPIQYHLDSRIGRAKLLLATTSSTIGDIAEMVGFQNVYSFSRAFKKRENVSPSVYRR